MLSWNESVPLVSNVRPVVDGHRVFTFDYLSRSNATQMLACVERSALWRDSRVAGAHQQSVVRPQHRRQQQIGIASADITQQRYMRWFTQLGSLACDLLGLASPASFSGMAQFQRSRSGDYFEWHRDVSAKHPLRAVCICYLSDFRSHGLVAGTTDFKLGEEIHHVVPTQGQCVIFDPNILHRGALVTCGIKYTYTFGWI